MKINLISPANKHTRNGNRTSIVRWAKFLKGYGHNTQINTEYDGSACDIMIALHAWHSAEAINLYKTKYPKSRYLGIEVNTHAASQAVLYIDIVLNVDAEHFFVYLGQVPCLDCIIYGNVP